MPVTSATSNTTAGYSDLYNSTGGATRKATKTLGSDEFMKLLATQFQNQDPMKPMEDTAFIAQMAQFNSLEQMNQLRTSQQLLSGASYLGATVTVDDGTGKEVTGVVGAVENTPKDGVLLTIGDTSYPISSVRRIEPTVPLTTSNTPTGTTSPTV